MKKLKPIILFSLLLVHIGQSHAVAPNCDGIVATASEMEQQTVDYEKNWPRAGQQAYILNHEKHVKPIDLPLWNSLFDEEKMAILQYTESSFGDLNRELRSDNLKHVTQFRVLCSALNKLPEKPRWVYRILSMTPEDFGEISEAGTYYDAGYMSSATDLNLIWGSNTLLKIFTLTGRSIEVFSAHGYEKEVLIPAGRHFKVIQATERAQGRFRYELILREVR